MRESPVCYSRVTGKPIKLPKTWGQLNFNTRPVVQKKQLWWKNLGLSQLEVSLLLLVLILLYLLAGYI